MDRRSFVAVALSGLMAGHVDAKAREQRRPLLDLHVHLFGVGEDGTGCRMARSITESWQFRLVVGSLGLRQAGVTLDESYERVLAQQLAGLGFD